MPPHLCCYGRHEFEDRVFDLSLRLRNRFSRALRCLWADTLASEQESIRGIGPPFPLYTQDGSVWVHVAALSDGLYLLVCVCLTGEKRGGTIDRRDVKELALFP